MSQTILDIYSQYKIPPNLQRHQLEVATVGQYVIQHWVGSQLNADKIIQALLLHDMGNIIKFKRPFLGELESQGAYWESVQAEFIQTYGNDAHEATLTIVKELGLLEITNLLESMRHVWENLEKQTNMEARICEFADCCVTPEGIVGFDVRIQDLKTRYHQSEESEAIRLIRENAKIIEANVNVSLKEITQRGFSKNIDELKQWII